MMLSEKSILSRIAGVIREYNASTGKTIRCNNLSPDDHFCNDLGGDSMDLVAMMLALEDEFQISVEEEKLLEADPWILRNLVKYINQEMKE